MTTSILQRVFALADASTKDGSLYGRLASVARKLAAEDDAASKAHTISGVLKDLTAEQQECVVAAAEALHPKPAKA